MSTSIITEIRGHLDQAVQGAKGWVNDIEQRLPQLDGEVTKITGSVLFKAVEAAVLTPPEEAIVTRLVNDLVNLRPAAAVEDDQGPAEQPAA